jgi:hypothetical protein
MKIMHRFARQAVSAVLAFTLGLVCLLGAASASAQVAAVGLVIDAQGTSTLRSKAPLEILAEVPPGAELTLAAAARVVVVHGASGVEYTLTGPGEFRWSAEGARMLRGSGSVASREPLGGALREVRLRTGRLVQASIAMRGEAGGGARADGAVRPLRLTTPASTWLLEAPQQFRWSALAGVQSYRFELTDDRGTVLFVAERLAAAQIDLPAAVRLEPGRTYAWQVIAQGADGSRAEGWTEFGIAAPDLAARVRTLQPAADAQFTDRLLYAALLEEWGLREMADAVWARLRNDRPGERQLEARAGAR